jgi:uncharacterized membrane protein YdjX (TVP38/TMEM64 family)
VKRAVLVAAVIVGLIVAWRLMAGVVDAEAILDRARAVRATGAAALLVPPLFVGLSLALVPIGLLRVTTVLVFGPLLGPLYAIAGVAAAALVGHWLGKRLGSEALERRAGPRVKAVRDRIAGAGVLGVAALRLVPLGPFMFVNAVGGAAGISRGRFVAGTVIGMMPGLIVVTVAGGWIERLIG